MIGYLQSQDRASERLKIGPDEDSLVSASAAETGGLPLLGWFSLIAKERALFYRWNGELRLRIGEAPAISLQGVEAHWSSSDRQAAFTLKRGGRILLHKVYPLSPDVAFINDDPTPFVEAEHFDFFMFIRNVLSDPRRAERFGRNG